jgi:hypothetical protein
MQNFFHGKKATENFEHFLYYKNTQNWQPPNRRKFGQSGVDVMITNFCDFCQFSSKKWRFSENPMLLSNFCKN